MACIPPNPRRVGYIDPIHGPLDGPLYMGSHIHQYMVRELVIELMKVQGVHYIGKDHLGFIEYPINGDPCLI